jgi:hypothetical protein
VKQRHPCHTLMLSALSLTSTTTSRHHRPINPQSSETTALPPPPRATRTALGLRHKPLPPGIRGESFHFFFPAIMHVTFGLRNLLLTFSGQLVLRPTLCSCKKPSGLPIALGSSILNFGLSLLRPTKLALANKAGEKMKNNEKGRQQWNVLSCTREQSYSFVHCLILLNWWRISLRCEQQCSVFQSRIVEFNFAVSPVLVELQDE